MNLSDGRRSVSSCLPFSTHLPLQVPRANSDCVSTTALPSTSVGAPDIQDPLSDAASDGLPLSAFSDTYDSTAALSATEPVDEISVCAFSASATAVNIPEEGVGEDVHDEDPVDAAPIAVASPIAFAAPAAVPACIRPPLRILLPLRIRQSMGIRLTLRFLLSTLRILATLEFISPLLISPLLWRLNLKAPLSVGKLLRSSIRGKMDMVPMRINPHKLPRDGFISLAGCKTCADILIGDGSAVLSPHTTGFSAEVAHFQTHICTLTVLYVLCIINILCIICVCTYSLKLFLRFSLLHKDEPGKDTLTRRSDSRDHQRQDQVVLS